VRRECLDHILIHGQRHLAATMADYLAHYNQQRPHQGRQQLPPNTLARPAPIIGLAAARVRRRTILNGLINEYVQAA
jgi:putative transposase